jgi:hypothetical protein
MELAIRVEVEVTAVATSSITPVVSLPPVAAGSSLSSPHVNTRGDTHGRGEKREYVDLHTRRGSTDDAHPFVGAAVLATVAQQRPFLTCAM